MKKYATPNGEVFMELVGYDEPNNGRMLYIVRVVDREKDITQELITSWNRIFFDLDKFVFCSPKGGYCFFPFESNGILYHMSTCEKLVFDYHNDPPTFKWFIGNLFLDNQLVVVFDKLIVMINLETKHIKRISAKINESFEWIEPLDANTIGIVCSSTSQTQDMKRVNNG